MLYEKGKTTMAAKQFDLSAYVITDRGIAGERSIFDVVAAALRGGATMIQLREKEAPDEDVIEIGQQLKLITREAGVPLIINDRVEVALALDAEGVHLGQGDLAAEKAREMIGPQRILGISAETLEQAQRAVQVGANYLGVGDVYGTRSKPDTTLPIGLNGLAEIARAVAVPVVAIGGITLENVAATIHAGAAGVSVISAVMAAADPEFAARQLRQNIEEARERRQETRS